MQVVTKQNLANFTEKLLTNDKSIKDELKDDINKFSNLVEIKNGKNLYDKTLLYTGKHFKYGSSSGYYFLNAEPKYSSVFIPVKEST